MTRSLVIETWNLGSASGAAERGLAALLPGLTRQTSALDEVIVTHEGLDSCARARLEALAGRAITWVEVPPGAGYYEHKNLGFDATRADVVAFLDADCAPVAGWFGRLTAPIVEGRARVVAGATHYRADATTARRGARAALVSLVGTALDFPVFPSPLAPGAVRGFFANNVAFAREVFAARRFPAAPDLFKGPCQLLALSLQADGVVVLGALGARVEHAWPDRARGQLAMRLRRGADTRAMAPHLARAYAPGLVPLVARAGPLPGLALLGARACHAGSRLTATRPRLPALATGVAAIAAATAVDAVGVVAARAVRSWIPASVR